MYEDPTKYPIISVSKLWRGGIMNLYNFMNEIDETILNRGLRYFKDGHVLGTKVLSNGWVEVLVVGHDDYTVSVQLADDGTILKANCACPYRGGPICKHEVAAFYSLSHSFTPKESPLASLLKSLSIETLVAELLKVADENPMIYERLMAYQQPRNQLATFERELEERVAKHIQFDHEISRKAVQHFVDDLYEMLGQIKEHASVQLKVEMMLLLQEECEGVDDQIDDSDAIFSEFLGELHAQLQNLIFMTIDYHQDIDEVFSLLMSRLRKNTTWVDFELLDLLSEYGRDPRYLQRMIEYIETMVEVVEDKVKGSLYKVWYELLVKYQEESLDAFLERHADVPVLTEFRVEQFVLQSRYEEAIPLILELESFEENRFDATWKMYRYTIYEKMKDIEAMKKLAYELFVQGNFDYYGKLKKLYGEEFPFIYDSLKLELRQLEQSNLYLKMIEKEKDQEALLAYVKEDLRFIERFASLLWDRFETEVHELYEQYIKQELMKVSNRSGYRRICAIVKRYHAFITEEAYQALIYQFIVMYPRRRALIEELQGLLNEIDELRFQHKVKQLNIYIT